MVMNRFSLEGKTVLITGASSGIGLEIAKGLSESGAKIAVAARRVERLNSLVDEINRNGYLAFPVKMDVGDPASIRDGFDKIESNLGKIDVLINNAGILHRRHFLNSDPEIFNNTIRTNLGGVWFVAQEAAKRMVAAHTKGSIINIASVLGLGVNKSHSAYCASKGAVIQLTRAMAIDLAKFEIRVNAIAPGGYRTEMMEEFLNTQAGKDYISRTPAKRLGELEELIGPILLLASDAGSFVNGSILAVDGAHHALLA